jgi:hypothetical protein
LVPVLVHTPPFEKYVGLKLLVIRGVEEALPFGNGASQLLECSAVVPLQSIDLSHPDAPFRARRIERNGLSELLGGARPVLLPDVQRTQLDVNLRRDVARADGAFEFPECVVFPFQIQYASAR